MCLIVSDSRKGQTLSSIENVKLQPQTTTSEESASGSSDHQSRRYETHGLPIDGMQTTVHDRSDKPNGHNDADHEDLHATDVMRRHEQEKMDDQQEHYWR